MTSTPSKSSRKQISGRDCAGEAKEVLKGLREISKRRGLSETPLESKGPL
jgi:hypothetical protein